MIKLAVNPKINTARTNRQYSLRGGYSPRAGAVTPRSRIIQEIKGLDKLTFIKIQQTDKEKLPNLLDNWGLNEENIIDTERMIQLARAQRDRGRTFEMKDMRGVVSASDMINTAVMRSLNRGKVYFVCPK